MCSFINKVWNTLLTNGITIIIYIADLSASKITIRKYKLNFIGLISYYDTKYCI